MIVDVHCHLDSFEKSVIPKEILPIITGYSNKSNKKAVQIAKEYNLPYVLGIAPQTSLMEGVDGLNEWIEYIKSQSPVAIGEVGLDFHWGKTPQDIEKEKKVFNSMINLSKDMNLPLVLHSRKAEREVFETLKENNIKNLLMHCYSGDAVLAKEIVEYGGLISISPIHSKKKKKVIKEIPLESLVVETDAPYLASEINGIKKSIEYIANVKEMEFEKVVDQTTINAKNFFGL